jgi:hypothetical protein
MPLYRSEDGSLNRAETCRLIICCNQYIKSCVGLYSLYLFNFYIYILIQFFFSSTCFDRLMFIFRKAILYMLPFVVRFSCIYASSVPHQYPAQPPTWQIACTNAWKTCHVMPHVLVQHSLPEDKHQMSKHEEDGKNWTETFILKSAFCWLTLYNTWLSYLFKVKGKAIPLQPLTGPEGSRRLRLPDFKTIGTWRW